MWPWRGGGAGWGPRHVWSLRAAAAAMACAPLAVAASRRWVARSWPGQRALTPCPRWRRSRGCRPSCRRASTGTPAAVRGRQGRQARRFGQHAGAWRQAGCGRTPPARPLRWRPVHSLLQPAGSSLTTMVPIWPPQEATPQPTCQGARGGRGGRGGVAARRVGTCMLCTPCMLEAAARGRSTGQPAACPASPRGWPSTPPE